MWFLGWWPHALLHGLNPFVTHAMFYPDGYNLTWAASLPLPALVLAPITLAFGPVVSWNVLELLSPALSSWTASLLCRHVSGRLWPSLIGGYLFGFSPYVLSHLVGAPNVGFVALLPLFVLIVLQNLEGSISPPRFVGAMAVLLAAQYLIGSELLATSTLFGAIVLVLAYALFGEHRGALLALAKLLPLSYASTAILISPFLYYFVSAHHYPPILSRFPADLASFVLPPALVAAAPHATPIRGANAENYLGVPLIVLIGLFLRRQMRERATWLLGLSLLIAAIFSLGGHLIVRTHRTVIPLPWLPLEDMPLLRYALPSRFGVFVALPAAVVVALWLSRPSLQRREGAARVALVALAIAAIVPNVGSSAFATHAVDPPFFSSGLYRRYLTASDHVLTIPALGPNERWVADAGFPFALTAGYAAQRFPAGYTRFPIWRTFLTGAAPPDFAAQLRRFVAAKGVTAVVVDETVSGPWRSVFGSLGIRPVSTGGVLLYRLQRRT